MTANLHDLLGAYTLDALDELERARFKAHLARCRRCQSEFVRFQAAAALLDEAHLPPEGQ